MKRITIEQAAGIVGGDECHYENTRLEYRSNGTKACVTDYVCTDKHGTSRKTEDTFLANCPNWWE